MTDVVLPALEQCRDEGWYDPSAAERSAGIEPLSGIMDTGGRPGQLHYLCDCDDPNELLALVAPHPGSVD